MEERDMPKADFITSIIMILFSIGAVILSIKMPRFEYRNADPWSVPGIVPGVLGVIIDLLGIILLIRSVKRQGHKLNFTKEKTINWFRKPSSVRLCLTLLLTLIYALGLVGRVSYPVATFLFIAAFIIVFEYDREEKRNKKVKRILSATLTAIIASAAISALFQYAFLVRLP